MPIVSLKDRAETFTVNEGEILYDSLADRGLELPHGCLSGSCGACRVEIISGETNLAPPGFIEQNTIESLKVDYPSTKFIRLSCRAKVLGNVCIAPLK